MSSSISESEIKLFTGTSNPRLGNEVSQFLGIPVGKCTISRFASGEIHAMFLDSVRGRDVFVVQSMSHPINDNLVELMVMLDALKRASAGRISVVMPYYGYARQEKKVAPREPISARMVADVLSTVGADRVVTIDLHAPAIQGFFNIPVDHLTALPLLSSYIVNKNLDDAVVIAPDAGGLKKAEKFATRLDLPIGVMYKRRTAPNVAEVTHFIGDVENKTPIIIEDIIDTGGSIMQIVEALLARGCNPNIYICATHALLSPPAVERLSHPGIKEIVVTNSCVIPPEKMLPNITVLSVGQLIADAIKRIYEHGSISELFI